MERLGRTREVVLDMLRNKNITIYNIRKTGDSRTYVRNVFYCHYEENIGGSHEKTDNRKQNVATILIPLSVQHETGKSYVLPQQFSTASGNVFTFKEDDIVIPYECSEEIISEREFAKRHPELLRIVNVETCDYGSYHQQHWEVTCG